MPLLSKPQVDAEVRKNRDKYINTFRVNECELYRKHKCGEHAPYTCFDWHFPFHRRRKPELKIDGSYKYSADKYCSKYDETTGICPDGDDCPFLHRIAGDTERRFHPRYYKTCMCLYDTDTRGFCVKFGRHCPFAHTYCELRTSMDFQAHESADGNSNGTVRNRNVLDEESQLMDEDPKWKDLAFVREYYKTEECPKPFRLCRQGYECPYYHDSKDKRRHHKTLEYTAIACSRVKPAKVWCGPVNCHLGEICGNCHTHVELLFHPEIYKSNKCRDFLKGHCPRKLFCAFAHTDDKFNDSRAAVTGTGHNDLPAGLEKEEKNTSDSFVEWLRKELQLVKMLAEKRESMLKAAHKTMASFLRDSGIQTTVEPQRDEVTKLKQERLRDQYYQHLTAINENRREAGPLWIPNMDLFLQDTAADTGAAAIEPQLDEASNERMQGIERLCSQFDSHLGKGMEVARKMPLPAIDSFQQDSPEKTGAAAIEPQSDEVDKLEKELYDARAHAKLCLCLLIAFRKTIESAWRDCAKRASEHTNV